MMRMRANVKEYFDISRLGCQPESFGNSNKCLKDQGKIVLLTDGCRPGPADSNPPPGMRPKPEGILRRAIGPSNTQGRAISSERAGEET